MRNDYMRVEDLKSILNELPDDMLIVIPVVDEDNVNTILAFRKVLTAGILRCESEEDKDVFCINGAMDGQDISDQIRSRDGNVDIVEVLYGNFENEREATND